MTRLLLILFLIFLALPASAQDEPAQTADQERSLFTSFIENRLSTPNRQIRINGIRGALSSQASIAEITVADREGVWLRIVNASIDWSRSTLILRQRLEIARLAADSIEVIRRPVPEEGLPSPEARSFSIPDLPVAINLAELEVPRVAFGQAVFGQPATLSVEGQLRLEGGSLDTALDIVRTDGVGGQLRLDAQYANETDELDLDFELSEPEDGVVANLLNIEGRPPLSLTLEGSGPVETLDLSLSLAAAGEPALSGDAQFRRRDEGLGFDVDVGGPIVRLIPARFRSFFGADTSLQASGVLRDSGGFSVDSLDISSSALTLSATAETADDGFLTTLSLRASIEDMGGERVLLPVQGGETSVLSAQLTADYGEAAGENWHIDLDIDDLQTGTFAAQNTVVRIAGQATNLAQPANRAITFDLDGAATGITAERADISEAIGDSVRLSATGEWQAGEALSVPQAELVAHSFTARLAGQIIDYAYRGEIRLAADEIAPFSGLAGRPLGGSLELTADGELRPISGAFDLALDGTAQELSLGTAALDRLLAGTTRITGGLARGTEGLSAEDFRLANEQVELTADGAIATEASDFRFGASIADLALLTNRASGRLTASGTATGREGDLNLSLEAAIPQGRLLDKDLADAQLAFDGVMQDRSLSGEISGEALIEGTRAALEAELALAEDSRELSNIDFTAQGARLTGSLTQDPEEGLLTGDLALDASDISTAAALFLVEAEGAAQADITLAAPQGEQHLTVAATLRDIESPQLALRTGDIEVSIDDLFGVPVAEGTITARNMQAAGVHINDLSATAERSGETTSFSTQATLANGTDIAASGALAPQDGGYLISVEEVSLEQGATSARLLRPATLSVEGQTVRFEPIELDIAGGRVSAEGEIGVTYDVTLLLDSVPLSIGNTIRPDLQLGGTLDGRARITGRRQSPEVSFDLTGRAIRAAALAEAGIQTLSVDATGTTANNVLDVDARLASPGGLTATVTGQVPLAEGTAALDVNLQAFPLSLLNRRLTGLDLGGTLTGSARITGDLAAPEAQFNLEAANVTARQLTQFGAAPLDVTASGSFADRVVTLETFQASGPAGLSISGSGRIPISGSGLAVNAQANVPLALANRLLSDRGTQFSGNLSTDLTIRGSAQDPQLSGTLSIAGATVVDPMANVRLSGIDIAAGLSRNVLTIRSASGSFAGGGTISAGGTISLNAAAGFPADLRINLSEARYSDGKLVTATLSGALTLSGPVSRGPLIAGNVTIDRAEILVPESFGGSVAQIDVEHINAPPAVQQTLERARAEDGTPMPSGRPSVLRLDITVDAPARIFVRGRGLDAEMGGSLRLTGPVTSIQPVGGFRLIRGRLSILTQRITFDEGTVSLVGDLDPLLNFVARSEGTDITVFITVSGRVSDLDITFSSQPALPEDEVLARLIFNRGIDELSPLQLAQLAAAAAELAGGASSPLSALREATGLDDIDIVTEGGNVGVRAGRYIQENIYLGVEAGSAGTEATINLDITENLRARGSVGTEGDSGIGIFYEKDY